MDGVLTRTNACALTAAFALAAAFLPNRSSRRPFDSPDPRRQGKSLRRRARLRRARRREEVWAACRSFCAGPFHRRIADARRGRSDCPQSNNHHHFAGGRQWRDATVKQMAERGTKIITVDTVVADPSFVASQVITSNVEGGKAAAAAMIKAIGGKGPVLVITNPPGSWRKTSAPRGSSKA